jgi:hypothetical protein
MTHCTSTIVAFRFVCSAGNATLTTVLSIKAILEARVVATSTQRPANFEQGALAGRERITLSSQGSRVNPNIMMARHCQSLFSGGQLRISIFHKAIVGIRLKLTLARSARKCAAGSRSRLPGVVILRGVVPEKILRLVFQLLANLEFSFALETIFCII